MEARLPNAREAAEHLLSWLDAKRDEAAIFTFDTRLDEVTPFTVGLKTLPSSMSSVVPFGATSLNDAIAQTAERVGRSRRAPPRGRGVDRRQRQREPDGAGGGVRKSRARSTCRSTSSASSRRSTIRRPTRGRRRAEHSPLAGPLTDLAARTGGHVLVASTIARAEPRGAADRRRTAASVSDGVRVERKAGLAFARGPRARQGSHGAGPERLRGGAIYIPIRTRRRSDHVRRFFMAVPIAMLVDRRVDGVRDQEVRAHQRRRSERQGRLARQVGRGDAGADAAERRQDCRGRSEGAGARSRRSTTPVAPTAAAGAAQSAADAAASKADAVDKASKRLVFEVVLSEDEGNFKFGKTDAAG